jgi:hypothetical protein
VAKASVLVLTVLYTRLSTLGRNTMCVICVEKHSGLASNLVSIRVSIVKENANSEKDEENSEG